MMKRESRLLQLVPKHKKDSTRNARNLETGVKSQKRHMRIEREQGKT